MQGFSWCIYRLCMETQTLRENKFIEKTQIVNRFLGNKIVQIQYTSNLKTESRMCCVLNISFFTGSYDSNYNDHKSLNISIN